MVTEPLGPWVNNEVNPQPDVVMANQSLHMMVPPRQKHLRFLLAPILDPRVVAGLKSWIPGTQGLYPRFAPLATSGYSSR